MTSWLSKLIFATLLSFSVIVTSCVTHFSRPQREPIGDQVPLILQPLFSECVPTDGVAQFSAYWDEKNINSLEMVWNAPTAQQWDLQWNTPAGDSQLEVQMRNKVFTSVGQLEPNIEMDGDGILIVQGFKIPLFANEFPCLLNGKWPVKWLGLLSKSSSSDLRQQIYSGQDSLRDIVIESNMAVTKRIQSCATLKWGGYWGFFQNTAKICIGSGMGAYQVEIYGPRNYQVKWWTD